MSVMNRGPRRFGRYWRDEKGRLHRKDGPAVEYDSGNKHWYRHGVYQRRLNHDAGTRAPGSQ